MATPRIEIEYCTQCRWLLRAAWFAQELLSTFERKIGEVALIPGTGGVFEVRVDGETIWSRKDEGRFPDAKNSSARAIGLRRARDLVTRSSRRVTPNPTKTRGNAPA